QKQKIKPELDNHAAQVFKPAGLPAHQRTRLSNIETVSHCIHLSWSRQFAHRSDPLLEIPGNKGYNHAFYQV
ncbi:hypothetical protein, partial [Aeromonas veronii]|uniref:hypothetical protein n=1 Tax=Aeromonas veronii TaxID=654 RepID=UPI001959AB6D